MSDVRLANTRSISPFSLIVATVAMLACGLYALLITGPAMRIAAAAQPAREISNENTGFCEKFSVRAGTPDFLKCADELSLVRQKQTERDGAAEAGIL
ncbi:hypothetical protein I3J27_31110 [Bradyrhizobium xenonodulans]|uniref:Uncharacterized protein n=1 Tax=Bradyrhizobium xenonodulans TaxID=2736875 RepID=A0ABY7MGE4_9BRAD|nr:hypothetical protein [Bradyrhizobium xenonodulans]WBL77428.1 hypothetical protein I3J27_31110 [Bradyrhizobium xenonodulans]